ncbi:MAG: type VI secretion system tip protein VgrG [Gemmatimonadota bacterium]|jgi:type VI secretion system secreted protein VgrG|nr:type VI secretion system tip protein VgrG [Gemmatimonadota bacterium]
MATFVLGDRSLSLTTPLSSELLLRKLEGTEELSRLYEFRLDVAGAVHEHVRFQDILGKPVSAQLELGDGSFRYFSGIVRSISNLGVSGSGASAERMEYRLEVVPELWLLTRRFRSQVFQQLTVAKILEEVLEGLNVRFDLDPALEARNYCVQYRETDFDFVSRLMEEEGFCYFFEHGAEGDHRMVISNSRAGHPVLPGGDPISFQTMGGGVPASDKVQIWSRRQQIQPSVYTLGDFHFELQRKNPTDSISITDQVMAGTEKHDPRAVSPPENEVYDSPGSYAKFYDSVDANGVRREKELENVFSARESLLLTRIQELETTAITIDGSGSCRRMTTGYRFTLEDHNDADGDYVLTRVTHKIALGQADRSGVIRNFEYENSFSCIPGDTSFRPERRTPRPRIQGPETAIVVGPDGQEIFTDLYGRVKVEFHWDRGPHESGNSSCWVRVSTPSAGAIGRGMIHIPRVGDEVIVGFLEGDPDQPIILGSVFSSESMPPWALPEHKTRSGLRTGSTPEGSTGTFNELRFEDKNGEEHIYLHAEKELRVMVETDKLTEIGQHEGIFIKGGRYTEISGEMGQGEAGDLSEEGLENTGPEYGDTLRVEKKRLIWVGDTELHQVDKGYTLEVAEGSQNIQVRDDQIVKIQEGDSSMHISRGNQLIKVSQGKIQTEAMQSIEFKVGSNSIVIDQQGITLKGMMVKIEADMMLEAKGGSIAKVEGGGILMLKGAITQIN